MLAADDSFVARSLIEQELEALRRPIDMTKIGQGSLGPAQRHRHGAEAEGKTVLRQGGPGADRPGNARDGRLHAHPQHQARAPRFSGLPVVIHSSLSGSTNEDHVRSVGADGYVAKFVAEDLADTMRRVLLP